MNVLKGKKKKKTGKNVVRLFNEERGERTNPSPYSYAPSRYFRKHTSLSHSGLRSFSSSEIICSRRSSCLYQCRQQGSRSNVTLALCPLSIPRLSLSVRPPKSGLMAPFHLFRPLPPSLIVPELAGTR